MIGLITTTPIRPGLKFGTRAWIDLNSAIRPGRKSSRANAWRAHCSSRSLLTESNSFSCSACSAPLKSPARPIAAMKMTMPTIAAIPAILPRRRSSAICSVFIFTVGSAPVPSRSTADPSGIAASGPGWARILGASTASPSAPSVGIRRRQGAGLLVVARFPGQRDRPPGADRVVLVVARLDDPADPVTDAEDGVEDRRRGPDQGFDPVARGELSGGHVGHCPVQVSEPAPGPELAGRPIALTR